MMSSRNLKNWQEYFNKDLEISFPPENFPARFPNSQTNPIFKHNTLSCRR